ncbi:hypothetical protein [Chitinophaga sp. MM2321]|uniref:hypothetical protein n=1 Tax=Chitinophaga sp. MM2321 TaxID=3137178 RepID=UPI0032D583BE
MPDKLTLAALCSLLLLPVLLFAQSPKVERSKPFDEPEFGASRLLMLKNGNTLFFNFTRKEGINVVVYDKKHHAKPTAHILGKEWSPRLMDDSYLKGLYEINGNAVIFLEQAERHKPSLFRLIVDGKTGKLLKEEKIAELPKVSMGAAYGMFFKALSIPDFYVRKDPQSDYYAVGVFNSLSHDRDERIEVIHYNPDHSELNRAYYESPEGTYKYLRFLDMYVNRDEFVFITNYAYNTRSSGGKDARVLISRLLKGTKTFEYNFLDYTDDYRDVEVAMKYDSLRKKLYMLSSVSSKSVKQDYTMTRSGINSSKNGTLGVAFNNTGEYLSLQMAIVDPAALQVTNKYFIDHPDLSTYAREHLKYKKPYYGVIQDFRLNPDTSVTLMYEELKIIYNKSSSYKTGAGGTAGGLTSIRTRLGDIGVDRIDPAGKEIASYAVAKSQEAETQLDLLHINRRPMANWTYRKKTFWSNNRSDISSYFSYDYFNVDNKEMVIYNDYVRNIEDEDENYRGKKKLRYISDANTVCAIYDGTKVNKTYLFGDPGDENESRFCALEMNTRSEDGKSFATMMIERKGKNKNAYIVWVSF